MKTIKQWLEEGLSKEDYDKIKGNSKEYNWNGLCFNFKEALILAFNWRRSADGIEYWERICDNNGSKKEQSVDMVVESVREDLLRRSQIGIEKYGTTLEREDIDEEGWRQHLYEELLDAACYLKKLMIKK